MCPAYRECTLYLECFKNFSAGRQGSILWLSGHDGFQLRLYE